MGFFLKKVKIAKIIPLFKNVDPENITTYHPISLLPCFSKVLEYITGYTNIYVKKNYYTERSLDFKKVILETILLSISLIKSKSPLKVIITHSECS